MVFKNSARAAIAIHRRLFPEHAADIEKVVEGLEKDASEGEANRQQEEQRRQERRRRGFSEYRRRPGDLQEESSREESKEENKEEKEEEGGEGGSDGSIGSTILSLDDVFAEALEKAFEETVAAHGGASGSNTSEHLVQQPWLWGSLPGAARFRQRYVGHCNVQTDIKEATFLGAHDQLIACGSDDGRVFIYDSITGACLRALSADEDIVNCIRPHPSLPVLATSGIESVVKLWSPEGPVDDGANIDSVSQANQDVLRNGRSGNRALLNAQQVAALLRHTGLLGMLRQAAGGGGGGEEEGGEEEQQDGQQQVECRMA